MKKYMVYMDDGRDCFKAAIPAANEKAARKYVEGNGEVVAIKDVTEVPTFQKTFLQDGRFFQNQTIHPQICLPHVWVHYQGNERSSCYLR